VPVTRNCKIVVVTKLYMNSALCNVRCRNCRYQHLLLTLFQIQSLGGEQCTPVVCILQKVPCI